MPLISDPTLVGKRGRYHRTAQTPQSQDPTRKAGALDRENKHLVPGLVQAHPASSPQQIIDAWPDAPSGAYWFNFDSGQSSSNTFRVYMLNEVDGGGWLLAGQSNYLNVGNRSGDNSHPFDHANAWWGGFQPNSSSAGILGIGDIWHPNQDVGTQVWGWAPMKECLIASCIPGSEARGVIYRFHSVTSSPGTASQHLSDSSYGYKACFNHDLRQGRNPFNRAPYWYTGCREDTTFQGLGSANAGFNLNMDTGGHGHMRLGSGQNDSSNGETGMGIGVTYGGQLYAGHQWGFGWSRNSSLWGSQNRDEWCYGVSLWIR